MLAIAGKNEKVVSFPLKLQDPILIKQLPANSG